MPELGRDVRGWDAGTSGGDRNDDDDENEEEQGKQHE